MSENEGDEVVWWLKWSTRAVGAIGGITAAVCGIIGDLFFFKFTVLSYYFGLHKNCFKTFTTPKSPHSISI